MQTNSLSSLSPIFGATYLLDATGEQLGITQDPQACFPDTYKQILSITDYPVMEVTIQQKR